MDASVENTAPSDAPEQFHFPVSFGQQRLWFLDQLEGASAVYNIKLPVRLTGRLDADRLEQALRHLVKRHESLRTGFTTRRGEPVQAITSDVDVVLHCRDLREADNEELRRVIGQYSAQPFSLEDRSLFRAFLLRLDQDEHLLLLITHHIVSDAWSSSVMFRDLAAIYDALLQGREPSLPSLPVQYADFAVWQRDWLAGDELHRQMQYWQTRLHGAPARLELPTDRPRPARQTYNGARLSRSIPIEQTDALRRFAGEQSCTLFMVMVAAYGALLGRYSGQDDVLVGTPVANRRRTELEGLIGLFANTLVLRNDLSGRPGFSELLSRVRETSLQAFAHQDLPFEKLVEILQPVRDQSHAPLFQAMFILQNAPWEVARISGLEVSPGDSPASDFAKFDLTLSATEYEGSLWLNFEYNTDLFDELTIDRMATGYLSLLAGAIANPHAPVNSLPLEHATHEQGIWEPNETRRDYPAGVSFYDLFARRAATQPHAPAIEQADCRLSYHDLAQHATAIAACLSSRGANSGSAVAICLGRSPSMVCAVLAVNQSGAFYVPIDAAYPVERQDFMLQDSGAQILVTCERLKSRFADFTGAVIVLDDDGRVASSTGVEARPVEISDTVSPKLAYLIYTSGSTGRPKGVAVTGGAVVNFLLSMAERPGCGEQDRILAVTTLSFDIAVLELLLPLITGGTVILAPDDAVADGRKLAQLIGASAPTIMQATPATWQMLLQAGWPGDPDLTVLCGGEALMPQLAARLLPVTASLWNMYGPTETTIWSTCQRIQSASAAITVGKPIANTRVYVVDGGGERLPVGVAGELCIGGAGVAQGYHGQAELTAERFVADPCVAGARMYRTGDRGRWRADGTLEVLGRLDRQVKLRSFRIEPGEIEAVLGTHPQVTGCAVVLHDDRLVGYTVTSAPVAASALRAWLKARLPEYMVPAQFASLAALPLTPNGKLDRRALPAPGVPEAVAVGPRTAMEGALCSLFGEVLGLATVDVHGNFFDLGGHSLLATQLLARIRDALDVELPLRELFAAPSVAGLAQFIATTGVTSDTGMGLRTDRIMPREIDRSARAPLSFMQQRLWFLAQLDPGNPVYNLAWSVWLDGELDESALERAVEDIVRRHEALRTRFVSHDGDPVQIIYSGCDVSIQFSSLHEPTDEQIKSELRARARERFDLTTGPLLRVSVLRTGEAGAVLLAVVHHIVADGWSLSVLFRELAAAYNARRAGAAPDWPALAVQYADYAVWQRRRLTGAALGRQVSYWRGRLAGAPAALGLATDRPRPAVATHRGAWRLRRVDAELTAALHGLAREHEVTLFMVLLAAYGVVLGRYAGAEDVVIGTPIAGRQRTELEGLIGFFVNTLALRIDLTGNPAFAALLARVKQTALDAYAHQDLPFEKLVDELNPPRDTSRSPIFQVMFNLHNEPEQKLQLDGIAVRPFGIDRRTAKFELSLSVTESAQGLFCNVEYNTDLYDAQTVDALLGSVVEVLSSAVHDAQLPVASLCAGDAVTTTAPVPDFGEDAVARFFAVARAQPAALAVSGATGNTSYGTLADQARGVARALETAVGTGQRIGVLGAYEAPLVAGVLGTLAAGCAYVPLDPGWPAARLAQVCAQAELAAVLVDTAHAARGAALGVPVLVLEQLAPASAVPAVPITAATPAYIIYTSGSSGTPRGVVQTHGGLLLQVARYTASLSLRAGDRLSGLSGYAFDAAVQDLFGALLNGASLHPVAAQSPDALDRLVQQRVTVLHATPTVYRHLLGGTLHCGQDLRAVRCVVLGGEAMRGADVTLFRSRFAPGTRLVNGLGLTESTLALQYAADHATRLWGGVVPVGRAVPGLTVTLEDAQGRAGWCGEIVLRGAGLAAGYWRDAAATRAAFIIEDGAVVGYRTGDLGWRLPDGNVAYRGRRDAQLKLRGVRIEPGEVEHALASYPGVVACTVTVDRRRAGDARLVAYVEGLSGADALADLRAHLTAQLPAYLVPQAVVRVAALPRRGNGKVDVAQLPAPQWGGGRAVAADSALAAQLQTIWAAVLGLEAVSATADFFALGGHSLLATRLIARVRDALGIEVPLITLFEHPTVNGMAAGIVAQIKSGQRSEMPELIRQRRESKRPAG